MMLWWTMVFGCFGAADSAVTPGSETGVRAPTAESSASTSGSDNEDAVDSPTGTAGSGEEASPAYEDFEGAIVTHDCTYETYPYAIDILLSCGSERFDAELRLHTFKRHSLEHKKVFRDQRIAHRNQQLWFDGYDVARCIRFTAGGRLALETDSTRCSGVVLQPLNDGFRILEPGTGRCVGLGTAQCGDHAFTGGRECGGIDHRYLPLTMGDCESALTFGVETQAQNCSGEYPEASCF